MKLPHPTHGSDVFLLEAIRRRRSIREFRPRPLRLGEISTLLWAGQGVTGPGGLRAAPSAGARYPLETYLVAGEAEELAAGIYHYEPRGHALEKMADGDRRAALARAALRQDFIRDAPASIVIAAVCERTLERYGDRGMRYVHMDVGHAGQNVLLACVALGLGSVVVGAFDDDAVKDVLELDPSEMPLYILPVGHPR